MVPVNRKLKIEIVNCVRARLSEGANDIVSPHRHPLEMCACACAYAIFKVIH